jgi:hypothetical protein
VRKRIIIENKSNLLYYIHMEMDFNRDEEMEEGEERERWT